MIETLIIVIVISLQTFLATSKVNCSVQFCQSRLLWPTSTF